MHSTAPPQAKKEANSIAGNRPAKKDSREIKNEQKTEAGLASYPSVTQFYAPPVQKAKSFPSLNIPGQRHLQTDNSPLTFANTVQLKSSNEVVQRNVTYSNSGGVGKAASGEWAISDSLTLLYEHPDGEHSEVDPPAEIHGKAVGGLRGNILYGGYTVITVNDDDSGIVHQTFSYIEAFKPSPGKHSEKKLFEALQGDLATELSKPKVSAIVIEIRQGNSPCGGCQPFIDAQVAALRARYRKPVFVRASAAAVYETSPGQLGAGLLGVKRDGYPENDGAMQVLNDPDVTGMHLGL